MAAGPLSYIYQAPGASPFYLPHGVLIRSTDNASIPCDLENMDYQAFLAWVTEGNAAPEGWTGPTNVSG